MSEKVSADLLGTSAAIGYNQSKRGIRSTPLELAAGGEEFPCAETNLASKGRASF
jgi:hypothetical protein